MQRVACGDYDEVPHTVGRLLPPPVRAHSHQQQQKRERTAEGGKERRKKNRMNDRGTQHVCGERRRQRERVNRYIGRGATLFNAMPHERDGSKLLSLSLSLSVSLCLERQSCTCAKANSKLGGVRVKEQGGGGMGSRRTVPSGNCVRQSCSCLPTPPLQGPPSHRCVSSSSSHTWTRGSCDAASWGLLQFIELFFFSLTSVLTLSQFDADVRGRVQA